MSLAANLVSIPVVVAIHLVGIAVVAAALRVRLFGIHLGIGPVLGRRSFGQTVVAVHWFPLGGYVQLEPPEELIAEWEAGPALPGRSVAATSAFEKAILYSSGCVALVAAAVALLGFPEGFASFARAFEQILSGGLDPIGRGPENVRATAHLLAAAPFHVCVGVLSAKMAAFNLLPIPALNGFQILQSVLLRGHEPAWLTWALNLGVLVLLALFASYGVALTLVLWHA